MFLSLTVYLWIKWQVIPWLGLDGNSDFFFKPSSWQRDRFQIPLTINELSGCLSNMFTGGNASSINFCCRSPSIHAYHITCRLNTTKMCWYVFFFIHHAQFEMNHTAMYPIQYCCRNSVCQMLPYLSHSVNYIPLFTEHC